MRIRSGILALTGLLLLTIFYLPMNAPGAPCSNAVAESEYGLVNYLIPSAAACPGPDFTIAAQPSSLTISPGGSATSTIVLNSLSNFNGTVSLSTSSPPTCSSGCSTWSISPVSVTLGPNGTATSTLTISVGTSNSGNVTVYGASGGLTRSAVVTFTTSSSPDVTMSANPTSQTLQPGATAYYSIVLKSLNGFSGNVNLETPMAPCATYCWFLSAISVHLSAGGTNSSTLTITTTTGIAPGNYSLPVVGFGGGLSHQVTAYFTVVSPSPDFTMSANPATQSVQPGSAITFAIVLKSVGGFSGTITLITPLGVPCSTYCRSINPGSVVLSPGGTVNSTLTVTTQTTIKPGNYSLIVQGNSNSISHSVTASFTVPSPTRPDFAIAASPQSLIIQQGSSEASTITVTSIGGFQGTVNIVARLYDNGSALPSVTLNPASVSLAAGGTATFTLTASSSASTTLGTYSAAVTGTSGSISHTVVVTVTVVDPPGSGGTGGGGGGGRFL